MIQNIKYKVYGEDFIIFLIIYSIYMHYSMCTLNTHTHSHNFKQKYIYFCHISYSTTLKVILLDIICC